MLEVLEMESRVCWSVEVRQQIGLAGRPGMRMGRGMRKVREL